MNAPAPAQKKTSIQDRLKQLFETYGTVGITVYVVLCVLNFGGVYLAMQLGWSPESAVGQAGTFGAAYVVYKLSMPARIGGALVLTPLVARVAVRAKRPPKA